MIHSPKGKRAKQFGAYYTDSNVADFMVHWALRSPDDTVIDPSFGGGVFIEAALRRIETLGGNIEQISGVEIDFGVHQQVAGEFHSLYEFPRTKLILSDFFDVDAERVPKVDAVIGNPPYIRYQSFAGEARKKALRRAREQGVSVSGLASSWATFVVHACSLLKPGGRLAFVIPTEIGHAPFARPVLEYLIASFESVHLLTFKERLFPDINQDTLILLAEGKGSGLGKLYLKDFRSGDDLGKHLEVIEAVARAKPVDAKRIILGDETLSHAFISEEARQLYRQLSTDYAVTLGEVTDVGIGYVTGANTFFHLSAAKAEELKIERIFLKQAVFKGKALAGLKFAQADFEAAPKGSAGYLLNLDESTEISSPVKSYVEIAESKNVHLGYKCKARSPWYAVPGVIVPDAFLTYMSGLYPQLVANTVRATAPNTLHLVRIKDKKTISATALSLLWNSSLTALSTELEGHALGGGMLKLEPREARSVRIAWPETRTFSKAEFAEIDLLLRQGKKEAAIRRVDELVLQQRQGLSLKDCETLREAAKLLRVRRYYKGKKS